MCLPSPRLELMQASAQVAYSCQVNSKSLRPVISRAMPVSWRGQRKRGQLVVRSRVISCRVFFEYDRHASGNIGASIVQVKFCEAPPLQARHSTTSRCDCRLLARK